MPQLSENSVGEKAAASLAAVPVKRGRGRPPGSKNKGPKVEGAPSAPKEKPAKGADGALAGFVLFLHKLSAWLAPVLGYEKTADLTVREAEEGAAQLAPLAERIPLLITVAFWLGFPVWVVTTWARTFRRKVSDPKEGSGGGSSSGGVTVHPGSPPAAAPAFSSFTPADAVRTAVENGECVECHARESVLSNGKCVNCDAQLPLA